MSRPLASQPTLPSFERLHTLLSYDPETGILTWKERDPITFTAGRVATCVAQANRWAVVYANKTAGSMSGGYHRVFIDGKHHLSSRVIWKMVTGEEPLFIDHENRDRADNRFVNFRNVTHGVNMRNKNLYANNKSGFPGVEFHKRDKVWIAKIGVGSGQVQLGSFATKDEAIACKIGAQVVLDYHASHGRQNL